MAKGTFKTLPLATVQAIQAKAVALLLEGKTTMSTSTDGFSSSKAFTMPISEVMDECDYAIDLLTTGFVRRTHSDFRRRGTQLDSYGTLT